MARIQLPEWAKRKIGPLPVWAYGAVGGGLVIALYLRGHPFGAGSAPRAQVGPPGVGAGVGTGNLPRSIPTLETSPPGSPAAPGRVANLASPSRFISSFTPQRGYSNLGQVNGPVPQVGRILGGGIAIPEELGGMGGALQLSGVGPESVAGFNIYRLGEIGSEGTLGVSALSGQGPMAEQGFASYLAGERADLSYAPAVGFGQSAQEQALGPSSFAVPATNFGPSEIPPGPSFPFGPADQGGYAPSVPGASSAAVSYAPSYSIQSDIASSTPDYSVTGSTYSGPNTDVGPTSGGAGTSSIF